MAYDWLTDEIASVRTRRFFMLERPEALPQGDYPEDYVAFLQQHGTAKLYRQFDFYLVGVHLPHPSATPGHLVVGHRSCFPVSLAFNPGVASPAGTIYEDQRGRSVRAAPDFSTWLRDACRWARRQYKAREWRSIVSGPAPFTASELAVVAARSLFTWQLLGVSSTGELQFRVTNGSALTLPYLTVGLRDRAGTFEGGAWLPVGSILPGDTALVTKRGYDSLVAPERLEAFPVPDPLPEERERYWEFRRSA